MATTTSFDDWLAQAEPEDYEETYALYQCVENEEDYGIYQCLKSNDNKLFIKRGIDDDTLMLASDKAKQTFLSMIINKYCNNDDDIELWYGFHRAMNKDNS